MAVRRCKIAAIFYDTWHKIKPSVVEDIMYDAKNDKNQSAFSGGFLFSL